MLKSREKREKAVQRREAIRGIITERKGVSGGLRLDSPRLYKKCRLSASSGRGVCPGAAARRHFLEKPNKNTRLVLSNRLYIRDTRAARAYRYNSILQGYQTKGKVTDKHAKGKTNEIKVRVGEARQLTMRFASAIVSAGSVIYLNY